MHVDVDACGCGCLDVDAYACGFYGPHFGVFSTPAVAFCSIAVECQAAQNSSSLYSTASRMFNPTDSMTTVL